MPSFLNRFRATFRRQEGSIDLGSVVAGVIIIGVVGGASLAASTTVVPWAQDNKARQMLSNVIAAESAHFIGADSYTDYYSLEGRGLIPNSPGLTIAVNAEGGCFAATSVSSSGKIFYVTDYDLTPTTVKPAALIGWTPGDPLYGQCVPAPELVAPAPEPVVSPIDWRSGVKPTNSATTVTSVDVSVTSDSAFCMDIGVTGSNGVPSPWGISVDTSMPPWYGRTGTLWSSDAVTIDAKQGAIWKIRGKSNQKVNDKWDNKGNNANIRSGDAYTFSLCDSMMDAAPDRQEAYVASVVKSTKTGEWGGKKNCMVATMRGSGAYPFYSGWSEDVDVQHALNDFADRGLTVTDVTWLTNATGQTVTPNAGGLNASSYRVTNGVENAVIGSKNREFTVCLTGS